VAQRSSALPAPPDLKAPPRELVAALRAHLSEAEAAGRCADLLTGADPAEHADLLPYLAGRPGAAYPAEGWADHWPRVWGARGLLYVWDDSAAPAVVAGLDDEHWRPAEMCLKVSTKRELGEAGPRAAVLAVEGELSRVRVQAVRTLGAVGDTEHVAVVRELLDDEDQAVRRQAARSLTQLARRLDLEEPEL
jgi:HEAT repeats